MFPLFTPQVHTSCCLQRRVCVCVWCFVASNEYSYLCSDSLTRVPVMRLMGNLHAPADCQSEQTNRMSESVTKRCESKILKLGPLCGRKTLFGAVVRIHGNRNFTYVKHRCTEMITSPHSQKIPVCNAQVCRWKCWRGSEWEQRSSSSCIRLKSNEITANESEFLIT